MATAYYFIFLTIVEIIMYLYHFSIFFMLFFKRNEIFHSPFYSILRIIFAADFIQFLHMIITRKLLLIPSVLDYFQNIAYLPGIIFNISSYAVVVEFFGYAFIAFHLFTSLWFPLKHEKIWKGYWYKIMLICLPFLHICWRLNAPTKNIYLPSGNFGSSLFEQATASVIFVTSTVIYILTTFMAAVFNVLSFMKFICYKQKFSLQSEKEKSLLVVSLITFAAQFLRSSIAICNWLFPNNEFVKIIFVTATPIIVDIFVWSGSVSLFFTSSITRKAYFYFIFPKKLRKMFFKKYLSG